MNDKDILNKLVDKFYDLRCEVLLSPLSDENMKDWLRTHLEIIEERIWKDIKVIEQAKARDMDTLFKGGKT